MPPKRSIGRDNPIGSYKRTLDTVSRKRYDTKIEQCGGVDPFDLNSSVMSSDPVDFPSITKQNVKDYFTKTTCHVTGIQLCIQRGLESYELTVAGYVDVMEALYLERLKNFIVRGKVKLNP
jgi:hypothetical protein